MSDTTTVLTPSLVETKSITSPATPAKASKPARLRSSANKGRSAPPTSVEALPRRQSDLLSDSLAYAIKRTQVRCDEALARYLDQGISPARLAALSTIGANPGISQSALGGLLNIAGPSVVKVVDDLERLNLLRRAPTTDRRVYSLQLTDKGMADLERYQASIEIFEKNIAAALTTSERALLLDLLSRIAPGEA
ncbi:MAG TPA: MarR family transcriptional regulator [Terriglobales bacterium]|nr:MarR family transcriptional regulator [Terriglobales bacterium]